MPAIKGKMFRYSEADMEAAIEECRKGVPTATAAKKFGVPRVTLLNKVKGKTPIGRKMGRTCYVTEDIEKRLVTWAKNMAKQGFQIGKENLQDSVKKIVDDLKIDTPFKNGRPGKRWYKSFLNRHPDLITRQFQKCTTSRASVTPYQIKKWFQEVSTYLDINNHTDIFNAPHRVYNMAEIDFHLNPKGTKVLTVRRERSVYQTINTDEKEACNECYTVHLGGNAAGDVLPPMVIFKYKRVPRNLRLSVPRSWGIGRSDNGWMTTETFYEYICNIFHRWLCDKNILRPVILFIDGHSSYLSYHVSKFCSENGIIMIAIIPNATHLLQPMDVEVFKSLKRSWKTAVHSWRFENIDWPILRNIHFCPLLKKVLSDTLTPTIFQNGFHKCGLVPWNPDEVYRILEPFNNETTEITDIQRTLKINELKSGKMFLEKYIDKEKITKFKNCEVWIGPTEDVELFKFYKYVEKSLNNVTSTNLQPKPDSVSEIVPMFENVDTTSNTLCSNICMKIELPDNDSLPLEINKGNISLDNRTENIIEYKNITSTSKCLQVLSDDVSEIIASPLKKISNNNPKNRKKERKPSVVSPRRREQCYRNKDRKVIKLVKEKKILEEEKKTKNEIAKRARVAQELAKESLKAVEEVTYMCISDSDSSAEVEWLEFDMLDDLSCDLSDEYE